MTDQYQHFFKTPIGKFVIKHLGLPAPVTLERYRGATPVVQGAVLLGTTPQASFTAAIVDTLRQIHANTYISDDAELIAQTKRADLDVSIFTAENNTTKFKALVFDASGIRSTEQLKAVYAFFHPLARQIQASGRVIILGLNPDSAETVTQAIAQRALVGFVKSLGKELRKGITAQLIYADQNAADNLASTLRFFLSPRSAYVSGQVVLVQKADVVAVDWAKPLAGKTALVTGASRGIGEAIAHVLARDGAHVICLDVEQQQADLDRVAQSIDGSTLALDITAADAGEKIAQACQQHGGLDILVHNAGVTRDKTLANMKEQFWDMVININLSAAERINHYLLEHDAFNAHGRIICVSSISGIAGNLGQTNYATSKAGVIGLVKYTAPHLKNGMTINAVAPGFIETQMTAAIPFAIREAGRRMNALSQGGLPVDVAETIAWFATSASSGVNANIVRVCGQSLLGA
ncbi:3-oxoacyl-ACP reductase [Acinetobacter sp. ANC 4641]|uniref:3-oxoacyl-ACP reductase n=1 Tax=Acinetobacter sp. ANC 4641 TaxID=2529847 RepID=UPI00103BA51D|nr:3-oxoacyl-ACP reductase [Acinetobacter sp. ANC 4641]TCB09503.1 3-oxoacyl-ACP reductase [Acinetobacter sp. ANC 4641]